MSETVNVYFYKVSDRHTGEMRLPDHKATADAISQLNGILLVETEEAVAISALDKDGRYDPRIGDLADQGLNSVAEKPGPLA